MLKLTLSRVLWLIIGCLLALGVRLVWVAFWPSDYLPLANALANDTLWVILFAVSSIALFLGKSVYAVSLALYQRARAGDLMPAWILWAMVVWLVADSIGNLAGGLSVFVPLYRIWVLFKFFAAMGLIAAMTAYPRALKHLAERGSMTKLEETVAHLERALSTAHDNRSALAEAQSTLARLGAHIESAVNQASAISDDVHSLVSEIEQITRREGIVYDLVSDARDNVVASEQRSNGKAA